MTGPRISEAELQKAVIDLARRLGYACAHFRPAMTKEGKWLTPVGGDATGFPDLVIVGKGRVVFVELKQDGRYPSERQREWLARLRESGAVVHVWRPKDWTAGTIEAALRGDRAAAA